MSERGTLRRATGTKYPNIVCRYCAHIKTWHQKVKGRNEGPCTYSGDCDCEAWDYGVNVIEDNP
jgi:hypothetical protein